MSSVIITARVCLAPLRPYWRRPLHICCYLLQVVGPCLLRSCKVPIPPQDRPAGGSRRHDGKAACSTGESVDAYFVLLQNVTKYGNALARRA